MYLLLRWILNAAILIGLSFYLPGIAVTGWYAALVAALILGLINALIRPFVLILTLPATILTLGLFTFVINGLMFWLAGSVVKGFEVAGFWPAFWGAFIMTVVNWFVNSLRHQTPSQR